MNLSPGEAILENPIVIPTELVEKLRAARSVTVLTGAGVSRESGVPTFRDPDGLWAKFSPAELASMDAFLANPRLVLEWYAHRRAVLDTVEPNPGHFALAELARRFDRFALITQNVDGLHQRAGSPAVIELHGNLTRNKCHRCNHPMTWPEGLAEGSIPLCGCGGMIRPDVVWFGEMLPPDALDQAFRAAENCDVFFSIGTMGEVQPAASLPGAARRRGALTVEINPNPTSLSGVMDIILRGPSGVVLPEIVRRVTGCEL